MKKLCEKLLNCKTISAFLVRYSLQQVNNLLLINDDDLLLNCLTKILICKDVCQSDKKPCFNCANCLKVLNNNAVDVFNFPQNAKEDLLVGDVENILSNLYYIPLEFKNKFYVLNKMHNANNSAQNKLLKTLEEPPAFVKFIATKNNTKSVLPTILSRFQNVNVTALSFAEIENLFIEDYSSNVNFKLVCEICNGSLSNFKSLLENDSIKNIYNFCVSVLTDMTGSSNMIKYSTHILDDEKNLQTYFYILELLYRDLLMIVNNNESAIVNISYKLLLKELSKNYTSKILLKILKKLDEIKQKQMFNANITMLLDNFLIFILEVKFNANSGRSKI